MEKKGKFPCTKSFRFFRESYEFIRNSFVL